MSRCVVALVGLLALAGCRPEPVTLSGDIENMVGTGVVADVVVCVFESDAAICVESDAEGRYRLEDVPGRARLYLELTRVDYFPLLYAIETGEADQEVRLRIAHEDTVAFLGALVDIEPDPARGQLATMSYAIRAETGRAGTTVEIVPSDGSGPYYADENYLPDDALETTSAGGITVFTNVAPGVHDVVMTHPDTTCTPTDGWRGEAPDSVEARIEPGYITWVAQHCP